MVELHGRNFILKDWVMNENGEKSNGDSNDALI